MSAAAQEEEESEDEKMKTKQSSPFFSFEPDCGSSCVSVATKRVGYKAEKKVVFKENQNMKGENNAMTHTYSHTIMRVCFLSE